MYCLSVVEDETEKEKENMVSFVKKFVTEKKTDEKNE